MAANTLISTLLNAEAFTHPVDNITLLETHISWVLLTGQFAYKIKKPVNFGFLDFSTLEKRRHFCEAELQLNKRLAPALYLNVVPITGDENKATINGSGEVIEYALKMREFPQDHQLDKVLEAGKLKLKHMSILANKVAMFHQKSESIKNSHYGNPETIHTAIKDNFSQILDQLKTISNQELHETKARHDIRILEAWTEQSYSHLKPTIEQRKNNGFIRACHGDMHLRNMVLLEEDIVIFDCIEFNDSLRYIDVLSEVAFVVMDLWFRGFEGFAMHFLNHYLSVTGDYSGLKLFRLYLSYRAVVRAKVAILQVSQSDKATALISEYQAYMALASKFTQHKTAKLLITHGLSGSGKSNFTDGLLRYLPAIRLRSDVERKRLYHVNALSRGHSRLNAGIYDAEATTRTYDRMCVLAEEVLRAGWHVVVDATFLRHAQRQQFFKLAQHLGVEFVILNFSAPKSTLQQRIIARDKSNNDASEANLAVLDRQLISQQKLQTEELQHTLDIADSSDESAKQVSEKLRDDNLGLM